MLRDLKKSFLSVPLSIWYCFVVAQISVISKSFRTVPVVVQPWHLSHLFCFGDLPMSQIGRWLVILFLLQGRQALNDHLGHRCFRSNVAMAFRGRATRSPSTARLMAWEPFTTKSPWSGTKTRPTSKAGKSSVISQKNQMLNCYMSSKISEHSSWAIARPPR